MTANIEDRRTNNIQNRKYGAAAANEFGITNKEYLDYITSLFENEQSEYTRRYGQQSVHAGTEPNQNKLLAKNDHGLYESSVHSFIGSKLLRDTKEEKNPLIKLKRYLDLDKDVNNIMHRMKYSTQMQRPMTFNIETVPYDAIFPNDLIEMSDGTFGIEPRVESNIQNIRDQLSNVKYYPVDPEISNFAKNQLLNPRIYKDLSK
jgi:hypothetical protein